MYWFVRLYRNILGGPGAVSRVGINGGETFKERAREPLGCYY